jgi:predicted nucleic acid-binding Zn ribbon protein
MPTYVYRFADGVEVEQVHPMSVDVVELAHPDTAVVQPVTRVPQAAPVAFRGDGWARKT